MMVYPIFWGFDMAKSNRYVGRIIVGLTGLFLIVNMATTTIARIPNPPETTHLLLQEQIVLPLGPLVLAATPFQLAYCVLSICLVCLAILVCLANCLFKTPSN
jgi:hypothetical protein